MRKYLLAGMVLLLLFIIACGDGDDTPGLSPGSSGEPSIEPALTASEIIDLASPKLDNLDSFHFKLAEKGGGTPIAMGLEMTGASGDIVPPDRLKMKIEATWLGQFIESELVTVGTVTYMTNPLSGNWELLSDDFNAVTLFKPETGIKAVMESVTEPVRVEEEKVDGVPCFHLRGMLASEDLGSIAVGHAAAGLPVETDIWIGVDDFLMRKAVFDGQICEDEVPGIVRTLELSRFNEPVIIELPR